MSILRQSDKLDETRIVLELLQRLEQEREPTHRSLASELGIALGLTNAYLRRCVSKGLLKVKTTPARRYAYFLTQRGFAEKARLTSEYLSYSLTLFRQARAEYMTLFQEAYAKGCKKFVFVGISDLTEIAALCAMDAGVTITGVVDTACAGRQKMHLGRPVFPSFDSVPDVSDALVITAIHNPRAAYEAAIQHARGRRILLPSLLGLDTARPLQGRASHEPA